MVIDCLLAFNSLSTQKYGQRGRLTVSHLHKPKDGSTSSRVATDYHWVSDPDYNPWQQWHIWSELHKLSKGLCWPIWPIHSHQATGTHTLPTRCTYCITSTNTTPPDAPFACPNPAAKVHSWTCGRIFWYNSCTTCDYNPPQEPNHLFVLARIPQQNPIPTRNAGTLLLYTIRNWQKEVIKLALYPANTIRIE
jgi:hypothetical protein